MKHEDVKAAPPFKFTTRRQLLEAIGAIAVTTACGSSGDGDGTGGSGGQASSGGMSNPTGGMTGVSGSSTGVSGSTAGATGGHAGATGALGGSPTTTGGAAGSNTGGVSGGAGGTPAAGGSSAGAGGTSPGGPLTSPPWDNVPMCVVSKTDAAGQGPFFIHELEKDNDISLIRQDIRGQYNASAAPGVEMQLHLRLLDYTSTDCNGKPAPDVDVYIWHTDAQGYYSGFGARGTDSEQKPDTQYSGHPSKDDLLNTDRFCRGMQTTDAAGVVSFRSTFPGWYNGRDLHIHFVAFKKGSKALARVDYNKSNTNNLWLFTTQFYFDPTFSKSIHEKNEPYKARTTLPAYAGAMAADENGNSGLRAKATLAGDTAGVGGIVTAQMQILLNPA